MNRIATNMNRFVFLAALLGAMAARAGCLELRVDGQAIVDQLTKLAAFSDDASPAVTRILFTGERGGVAVGPVGFLLLAL